MQDDSHASIYLIIYGDGFQEEAYYPFAKKEKNFLKGCPFKGNFLAIAD